MKNVIVIGSGISGLSISQMLEKSFNVVILEKDEKIGGLIKCERIEGNLFHKVGGHVFNSKNNQVLEWFWKHFDRDAEFTMARRNAKIFLEDRFIGYPIENFLYQLSDDDINTIIKELLSALSIKNNDVSQYNNFEDFLIGTFGKKLYEIYFGPYNTKIWNTDISKVPLEWLEGKLPMPQIEEIILNNIIKKDESTMVHASFYYPKNEGSQFIVNRLSEGLEIKSSFNVTKIAFDNFEKIIVNDTLSCDELIYCGDIRLLSETIEIDDTELNLALQEVLHLPSNGTSNVLCETDETELSWLYLPEAKFKAHRIIYTGNFSDTNNSNGSRKTCVVEFSGIQSVEFMKKELSRLPGNLEMISYNQEENSYIIQHEDTRAKIIKVKSLLKQYNISLLGRFAEWEYYNMDKCIESALVLEKELTLKYC
jgi:protoporphyrinogen oxidase